MVDCQLNLDGWLEDVTLFPSGPDDYTFNFDELLSNGKTNNEVALDTDLPDLNWLDEKINFSILEDPKGLLIQPNETETLMLEDAARLLLDFDSTLDPSYLSPNDSKIELNDNCNANAQAVLFHIPSLGSSEIPLLYESISEASSPASFFSDGPMDQISEQFSPGGVSTCSNSDGNNSDGGSVVSVTVCDMASSSDPINETLSIDEVTDSVLKRQFVSNGKEVPKVHVSLKNAFHPYSKGSIRKGNRSDRKKLQNKEAAARYRIKKRNEENGISGEVFALETRQKKLQGQHNDLVSEIKYLKSLMREMFQKKGLLK